MRKMRKIRKFLEAWSEDATWIGWFVAFLYASSLTLERGRWFDWISTVFAFVVFVQMFVYDRQKKREAKKSWRDRIPEFRAWREEVDSEYLMYSFDLALGWFTGQGYSHEDSCKAAELIRDMGGA